jgi:hypothetical protein
MPRRPEWWDWELELSDHVKYRMLTRAFTEIEIRTMLMHPTSIRASAHRERWIMASRHARQRWEIVVQPDYAERKIVVVTVYPQP